MQKNNRKIMTMQSPLNQYFQNSGRRSVSWCALFATWLCILIAFRDEVLLVIESWEKMPSHAHGYVVVLVVSYLVWKKRTFINAVPFSPSMIGFAAFLAVALATLIGELVSAASIVQFSVIFLIIAAVWAILGYQAFKTLFGPLAFLFFTISFGQDVLPTLMDWTADATVIALRTSNIPVFQQDRHFIIPSGSWGVVEACSGIRYLFTAFFVGTIYAYINYRGCLKRLIFVTAMLSLALFANWLRAYTIVLVAHLSNNEWGLGLSHLTLGWVIFGVVIFVAFWAGSYYQDPDPVPPTNKSDISGPTPAIILTTALIVVLVLGLPHFSQAILKGTDDSVDIPELDLKSLQGLTSSLARHAQIAPEFFGASRIHQQIFRLGDADLLLYIAYYRNQTQGRELINVNNQLEPTKHWNWTGSRRYTISDAPVTTIYAEKYSRDGNLTLATQIYWNGGYTTQSPMQSKLVQAINLLTGQRDDGAAVIIAASAISEVQAHKALENFIQQHLAGIIQDLDQTQYPH